MRNLFLILFIFFIQHNSFCQTYQRGCNLNDSAYAALEIKANLCTRDYVNIPSNHSLKKYCPIVKNQIGGTCTAWATAYYCRTIMEAINDNQTNKYTITSEAYSPDFVYASIKYLFDKDCSKGSYPGDAFELMKKKGVPYYKDFKKKCPTLSSIVNSIFLKAKKNKIEDYNKLFETYDNANFKIKATKKSISENNPVVISMKCPSSLINSDRTSLWFPSENPSSINDHHAICVIGYDDNKYGGAFEIINSWGTDWGNNGFIWVKYQDFAKYTNYGFESVLKIKPIIKIDEPVIQDEEPIVLAGSAKLIESNNAQMLARFNYLPKGQVVVPNSFPKNQSHYKLVKSYTSGSKYRIYISNDEPCYVYVLSSDLTNNVSCLFPYSKNVSALLNYSVNNIALPDENHFIQLDNTVGTDYTCILFSKEKLDIDQIIENIEQTIGSFPSRINIVLEDKLVSSEKISYDTDGIGFKAKSSKKSLVALIVEFEHK